MRRKNNKTQDNATDPQAEAQERVRECQRAIEIALAQFQCIMEPQVVIRGTRIETAVRIHPRPAVSRA